jgi:hypothetical protein
MKLRIFLLLQVATYAHPMHAQARNKDPYDSNRSQRRRKPLGFSMTGANALSKMQRLSTFHPKVEEELLRAGYFYKNIEKLH